MYGVLVGSGLVICSLRPVCWYDYLSSVVLANGLLVRGCLHWFGRLCCIVLIVLL